VNRILDDNDAQYIVVLPEAPERTLSFIMPVEGGLHFVMVGGKEGIYPRAEDEAVLKFAREVSTECL
jgi:hypothetical protein